MKKDKIHLALVKYFDDSIKQIQKKVDDYKSEADLDESAVKDPEDMSYQNNAMDMLNHYKALLVQSIYSRQKLDTFPETILSNVMPGAVVETKQISFFIGVSTTPLPFNDKKLLIGISTESKLAQKLKSKKKGDTINYGKSKLTIKDIY